MSKSEEYVLNVGEKAAQRLALFGSVYQPFNEKFLMLHGLKKGIRVADVGCGTGNLSLWLAEQVGEQGQVVGFDISKEQLQIAEAKSKKAGVKNIQFIEQDVYSLNAPLQFDLVFCRFLLVHLAEPMLALQAMNHLVKPGGMLISAELDNYTWFSYPPSKFYDQHIELFVQLSRLKGLHFELGQKLYHLFQQLGFVAPVIEISQPIFQGMQKHHMELLTLECAQAYLETGLTDKAGLDELVNELQKLADDKGFLMGGGSMFQVAGIKEPA